jgi:oxygen-independent coproporphyrinogen-3 oxidase
MNAINKNPFQSSETLGIYCHIPFCVRKCAYCDFISFCGQTKDMLEQYFTALNQEITMRVEKYPQIKQQVVDSIYFGGGTPSSVEASFIEGIMELLKEAFFVSDQAEITIEVNPGTLTDEKARRYRQAGFNRVSVGLQVWQDHLLSVLGRIHCQQDFISSMELLKKAGFANISVDVMYGIPGQKLQDVKETLEALMAFSPLHLSCYSLILEAGTPLTALVEEGALQLPEESLEREMHWTIDHFLKEQGYHHYEISSFCKPGYESRHNLKYWELVPYLGFGLGAHGFYEGRRYGNPDNLQEYLSRIAAGSIPGDEDPPLTKKDAMSEWLFLGLRKLNGVDKNAFWDSFREEMDAVYGNVINALIGEGLLEEEGDFLRLTDRGQDFGNQVFMAFI